MNALARSFGRLDEMQLVALVQTARQRLAYLAPGVSVVLAEALLERWQSLGPDWVKIVLDIDPEVLRLGYGTLEGLQTLQAGAAQINQSISYQPGLRIGLVIVDDSAVTFAPTPQLIEAGTVQGFQPNALFLERIPQAILDELGWGELGVSAQSVGIQPVTLEVIHKVANDLDLNPPLRFDIAHQLRVFNARFEFVELEIHGAAIERIEVPLPAEFLGFFKHPQVQNKLHASYCLLAEESDLSGAVIREGRQRLVDQYLITLPGYGQVVLRADKVRFLDGVEKLRMELQAFSDIIREQLQSEIERNCQELYEALAPFALAQPPAAWNAQPRLFGQDEAILEKLEETISHSFGDAERWLKRISLKLHFKGVTYEMLNNPQFIETARRMLPGVMHEEFDAARGE